MKDCILITMCISVTDAWNYDIKNDFHCFLLLLLHTRRDEREKLFLLLLFEALMNTGERNFFIRLQTIEMRRKMRKKNTFQGVCESACKEGLKNAKSLRGKNHKNIFLPLTIFFCSILVLKRLVKI